MLNLNILVVSTVTWKSREAKHKRIKAIMEQGALSVSFTTELYKGQEPKITDEAIDYQWFEDTISKDAKKRGFNHVIFHFSLKEANKWGVKDSLFGRNLLDGDFFGESWIKCDENTKARFQDGAMRNRYEKDLPHEIGHELYRRSYTPLLMHDYDYKDIKNNLEQFYKDLIIKDISNTSLLASLKAKLALLIAQQAGPFFSKEYPITQAFGVPNKIYTRTLHHIGVDFACPTGTPILAPLDGQITAWGATPEVGNFVNFKTANGTYRFCHLSQMQHNGAYKKGAVIAHSGNTGKFTTGAHLHVEKWNGEVDVSKLTKDNFTQYVTNPI